MEVEQVTRENYRDFDAINYSKLSSLDKHPSEVDKDKDFSDGIRNGDLLDIFCYDGEDAVHQKYHVSTLTSTPSDAIKEIIDQSPDYSDAALLHTARELNYGASSWKDSTILRKIEESAGEYILELENAGGKPIITFDVYAQMQQAAKLLKNHQFTKDMFGPNWEHQVPLVAELKINQGQKHPFKCLLDGIYNEDKNLIIIHDLKYSSSSLSYFPKDFKSWKYYLQASLYTDIVRELFGKDTIWYNVVYSSLENKVQKFHVDESMIEAGREGFHDFSYYRRGYRQLAFELLWHQENDKWEYPYEVYMNNGEQTISAPNDT